MTQTTCYLRVPGCTAPVGDHPRADQTMYARCSIHSTKPGRDGGERGAVIQHYDRKRHVYVCWHCANDAFHAAQTTVKCSGCSSTMPADQLCQGTNMWGTCSAGPRPHAHRQCNDCEDALLAAEIRTNVQ